MLNDVDLKYMRKIESSLDEARLWAMKLNACSPNNDVRKLNDHIESKLLDIGCAIEIFLNERGHEL